MKVGIYKQSAQDIMTSHVDVIYSREMVRDAFIRMADNQLSALPVVDANDRCVGIISQSDLVSLLRVADTDTSPGYSWQMYYGESMLDEVSNERIEDVMSENALTVLPTDPVVDVADKMLANSVHHMPVCDEAGTVIGIISTMDILAGLRGSV